MRRPPLILLMALALGAAVFACAFLCARHVCARHLAQSTDGLDCLDWLRMEFGLNDAELARIRELHDGYLSKCEINCAPIAAKQRALAEAVAAGASSAATIEALRAEVARGRAGCQSKMLAHFKEVSRAMPPRQGARYLAEMKRLTLGGHEQIEEFMPAPRPDAHGHH